MEEEKKSVLICDGKGIDLENFILCGNDTDGNRIVLTWNTSLDENLVFKEILDITIQDQVREQYKK